jgi:hypothetical protein
MVYADPNSIVLPQSAKNKRSARPQVYVENMLAIQHDSAVNMDIDRLFAAAFLNEEIEFDRALHLYNYQITGLRQIYTF